jgi:hypothetical protein
MQPLKPEERNRILRDVPEARPEEIDEYERLLSEIFMVDPSMPRSADAVDKNQENERRLSELFRKLFPQGV